MGFYVKWRGDQIDDVSCLDKGREVGWSRWSRATEGAGTNGLEVRISFLDRAYTAL